MSFDNVLDQLSPYEIELLTLLFAENPYGNYPLASIKKTSQLGYNILYKNMANISFKNFTSDVISIMISNLERVGIIFIDYFQFVEPAKEYDYVQNSDLYIKISAECEQERNTTNLKYPNCLIDKHMFCLTEFGIICPDNYYIMHFLILWGDHLFVQKVCLLKFPNLQYIV